jgi:hypothetical protein
MRAPESRGLAATRRIHEDHELAVGDVQVHVPDSHHVFTVDLGGIS